MSRFFSPQQRSIVISVLDRLIPRQDDLPSTAEAGTVDYIDGVVADSKHLPRLFGRGLRLIESTAARVGGSRFETLSGERQDDVLHRVESEEGEFFETLVGYAYNGYYSNPEVVEALGIDPSAPQPRGNKVEVGDFSSLEEVQRRGQAYRNA